MLQETLISLEHVDKIRPDSIEDYIAYGGYKSLEKLFMMTPSEVIDKMQSSGLRGRGGAGFPTGMKKKFTYESCRTCDQRYVVCNADEGEPGTFKDRPIMERNPHIVIEGMIIAAWEIGASKGYIYLRAEYSTAHKMLQKAIDAARQNGFLGENILGSPLSFDIEISLGAGSYLCGEELTLLESLEGKRGHPRIKPPFPAEKGLFQRPTLINNVETLSHLPAIINKGAEWYHQLGTDNSSGTKIYTLSGDVKNPGYFELEMGVTLRQLIEIAGGMKDGTPFKTALLGGAAGTFVDSSMLDEPMDFDNLKAKGATLGSGAVMIFNEQQNIHEIIASILAFFKHESCGKCVPCRVGTSVLMNLHHELEQKPDSHDTIVEHMLKQADFMAKTSLCFLGQSPLMALKSAANYFKNEI
ncbi:MAG: NADH-ubiquinone oxidoreductase-F iron-sulfur binding region domain-containing protein [Bacteroidales bacterium]